LRASLYGRSPQLPRPRQRDPREIRSSRTCQQFSAEIAHRAKQQIDIVAELTESVIAANAKKAAHLTTAMVVVYVKGGATRRPAADRTPSTLFIKAFEVVGLGYSKRASEMSLPRLLAMTLSVSTLPSVVLVAIRPLPGPHSRDRSRWIRSVTLPFRGQIAFLAV
jgi:hypothetical protein